MKTAPWLLLPNQLTLGRLILCGLFVFSLSLDWDYAATAALVIFVVASLTDWLDGYLARKMGIITDFGKLLDPLADKVLTGAAFVALVEYSEVPMWIVVVIITREFLITGLRVLAARKGEILAAERFGKHKTISQMLVIIAALALLSLQELGFNNTPLSTGIEASLTPLLWITLVLTITSGFLYFYKNFHLLDEVEDTPSVAIPPPLPVAASPATVSTWPAFKEWNVIVEALGSGNQMLILRKGGIAEGRSGFQVKHRRFWLFPTDYHQQLEKTKPAAAEHLRPTSTPGQIEIACLAEATDVFYLEDWNQVQRLDGFHLWQESALRERFDYDTTPGLHLFLLRIHRLNPPQLIPHEKSFEGCKSWIEVPVNGDDPRLVPVLSDTEYATRRGQILAVL